MSADLTIDLRRRDGETTRLEGVAGLAVMMQEGVPIVDATDHEALVRALVDMPIVSLRASNAAQLAVLLGTLIAAVRDIAPEAIETALEVASITDAANPKLRRVLPRREHQQGEES